MSIVIQVENISKQYRLGMVGTNTIRDDVSRLWARMRGKEDPTLKIGASNILTKNQSVNTGLRSDYVWALKDINFSLKQGEILGIIGKNGAGKSTLLKILSKVTSPTTGKVKVKGRIASLLEVGTGFHPELSGRENIFLNGAILGMTKTEIRSKFDEIVGFSGVETYIDTPVKRYSSGMYVRLAFAVAAHLELEILIVDEVLAVGDAEFQKKALGKMQEVSASGGRTVLFVSHNMAAISSLTNKSICLANGKIIKSGITQEVINYYLNENSPIKGDYVAPANPLKPNFTKISLQPSESNGIHKNGEDLIVDLDVNMPYESEGMAVSIQIFSEKEIPIIYAYIFDTENQVLRTSGIHHLRCTLPNCKLYQGNYYLKAHLAESRGRNKFDEVDKICSFEVIILDDLIEWGWQKNVCIYFQEFYWTF